MNTPFDNAKWIGNSSCPAESAPCFRKSFAWNGEKAVLDVTGVGFYLLSVNGTALEDELLNPAFTRYDVTVYYQEIDITPYLQKGENELLVTVGNGWYNEMQANAWDFESATWKTSPRMLAALYLDGKCTLVSDSSWQTAVSGTIFNSLRCGESFDARIIPNNWAPAQVVPAPGGILKKQTTDPIRLVNTLAPATSWNINDAVIYDFGVNTAGNVEIEVEGPCGAHISMQYAEDVLRNGYVSIEKIDQHVEGRRFQRDEYILSGNGTETWHSHFGYNGYRYVQVRASKEVKILSIRAREFHTDLQKSGEILADNATITRVQSAILRSSKLNFHHMPTDCPHREKNGWTGDAWLSCRQMCRNFDMRKAYKKWLDDIVDCQRPNGQIPCIVPTSSWGYAWGSGITWDVALIAIPWEMYCTYGDVEILRRYAVPMRKYLGYLWTMLDNGIPAIGLGDWTAPAETDVIPDGALLTAMAVYACEMTAAIAELLEDDDLQAITEQVGECCENAFLREYGTLSMPDCQLLHALRLRFGLTDDVEATSEALIASLRKTDWHVLGGIFTARYVPEALSMIDRKDVLWKVITAKGYPGWDDLALICAGTLGEEWRGGTSMSHHMYSSVGVCFYEDIAGIEYLEPGAKRVRISPYIPEDLPTFEAWQMTPQGKIVVAWKNGTLTVNVPADMQAELQLCDEPLLLKSGENTYAL